MLNMAKIINSISRRFGTLCFVILLAQSSSHYQLRSYGFGSGGVDNATSANYGISGISGEVSENQLSGTNFNANPGLEYVQMANVPLAPTISNPSSWYNKLHFVVNPASNPTDTTFVIAVSLDNFATTKYIQADDTLGSTKVYQTYTNWGGSGGQDVIGLNANTTYKFKVAAIQGKYTETPYGPVASGSTVDPSIDFDIDVSATDTETDPPYIVDFGDLTAGSVVDSPVRVWFDFGTNANYGGNIYVYALNSGLNSAGAAHKINSMTANLDSVTEGFGAQGKSVTQSSGGPLTMVSPYNGSGNNVGITDTSIRNIFTSANPITAGRSSFIFKAKISGMTPASNDYSETLTAIAAASF